MVAGISTSNIKAEELDSALARAGVLGVTVPTAGAAAEESIRKESDKSSRASGAGNYGFVVRYRALLIVSMPCLSGWCST
jgi:hypothetical protein